MQPINPPQIRENPSTTWFSVTSSRNDGRANVARIFVHRGKKECLLTIKPFVCSKQDRKRTLQFLLSAIILNFSILLNFSTLSISLHFFNLCNRFFDFVKCSILPNLGIQSGIEIRDENVIVEKSRFWQKSRFLELRFVTLLARYKSSKIMTRGKRYDELQMKRRSFSRLIYFPGQKQKTNKRINTAGILYPFYMSFFHCQRCLSYLALISSVSWPKKPEKHQNDPSHVNNIKKQKHLFYVYLQNKKNRLGRSRLLYNWILWWSKKVNFCFLLMHICNP